MRVWGLGLLFFQSVRRDARWRGLLSGQVSTAEQRVEKFPLSR
jgi:hypothetical protein